MKRKNLLVFLLPLAILTGCGTTATNDSIQAQSEQKASTYHSPQYYTPNDANMPYPMASSAASTAPSAQTGAALSDSKDIMREKPNTEEYSRIYENQFLEVKNNPLSTFSIDVDTASYSNIRRFLTSNSLPPKDAVRIEEMINYFTYDYPQPQSNDPFSINLEMSQAPWKKENRLVHIGLQGLKVDKKNIPASNLVFLIDTSGSMASEERLPLLKQAFKLLVNELREEDHVSIVAYAGSAGLVLPPTPGYKKETIISAIEQLGAGGSTAGGAGIQLAYKVALENFKKNGNNRVILATDGDFNVGVTGGDLIRLIEQKRDEGTFLSVLGFGTGNYKDSQMEQLADKGNGNYAYIDNIKEAKKVFVEQMGGTLLPIAKDVKLQIEFNPAKVKAYRLIGYENRVLQNEDFNNDKKDAGELGAGTSVTALYEILPANSETQVSDVDKLKYQENVINESSFKTNELLTVKFRYKDPKEYTSKLIEKTLADKMTDLAISSDNFKFSAAVAGFGLLLRDSQYKGNLNVQDILKLAKESKGEDKEGYRTEFMKLLDTYQAIQIKQQ